MMHSLEIETDNKFSFVELIIRTFAQIQNLRIIVVETMLRRFSYEKQTKKILDCYKRKH